ncbi:juvenile hormone esterase [Asbolus verrucosus]|uniref:Carboxylic ester hydrolase n=1 Tax=Asbolus verrucosus TaxID=1661398 RepID=A0A482W5X2_ASBVE|nr:juvenile hormone esterase [Asbolus verrucosus]
MKSDVRIFLTCLHICCVFTTVLTYAPKHPIVKTNYGPVIGLTQTSRYGRDFMSFRGIPYAKPPVGELRFKAPEPPEPWSFAVNATQDAPYCIQKNYFFANPKVEGKEDCLYLNVYVPQTIRQNLLPVMVFIHWGGFFAGRGSSDIIGPEYIMDKDVILVSFNYRLGVFGFFTTLDDFAPGNFGLKDQVLALKFVQENIESFGGDKNRVTIFGQSAGGGSVSLHLISPSSRGLFQQAISQSGVALNLWAKPLNILQPNVTAALASFVGCADHLGNSSGLVQCLRKVDAFDLTESGDKFKYFSIEPLTPYSIVTEQKTDANPNPFLTKEPLEYLQNGEFQKVPWIVGNVQDEGILRVAQLVRQPEVLKTLNDNFNIFLPQMLALQLSVVNTTDLFKNLTNFYLGGNTFIDINNTTSVQGFINLYSDRSFTYGTFQSVILQSQKLHRPIWLYNFNYKGQYTYGDPFAATTNKINFTWGVSHCDDLLYLFKTPALFPELQEETDLQMSEDLLTLWTNFAIYGESRKE